MISSLINKKLICTVHKLFTLENQALSSTTTGLTLGHQEIQVEIIVL